MTVYLVSIFILLVNTIHAQEMELIAGHVVSASIAVNKPTDFLFFFSYSDMAIAPLFLLIQQIL